MVNCVPKLARNPRVWQHFHALAHVSYDVEQRYENDSNSTHAHPPPRRGRDGVAGGRSAGWVVVVI